MRKARRVYGRFTAPTLCVAVLLAGAVSAQANDRAVDDAFWNTVKSCAAHEAAGRLAAARACLKKLQLADDRAVMDDEFWNTVKSCTNVDEVRVYLE